MFWIVLLVALAAQLVHGAPAAQTTVADLGITFEKRADNTLPLLTLPYGTWRAAKYDDDSDIYAFKNIRFAAPPVGNLRWAKPALPLTETTVQDGSIGQQCIQSKSLKGINLLGPGAENPAGGDINQFLGGLPFPEFGKESEDCLFLDLYVPGKAIRNSSTSKLPIVVWLYGGAYAFGSKDGLGPFYEGNGLLEQSGGNIIFVAGNYRLGAYGFLAGATMEKDGLPNAGLWDQRAVFQWVQDYISLVGGDKSQVSAWGESAGAGSIFHHLVGQGGTLDPMFTKTVTQSAAYEPLWDRRGSLEHVFQNFTQFAGCAGQGVACLRAADAATLKAANKALNEAAPDGSFIVGPSADGNFIGQLAPLEFASGNYWKGIQSLIVSHVKDEANLFVDGHIQSDAEFQQFLGSVFPDYVSTSDLTQSIIDFYPSSSYPTQTERVKAFVRDSSFTCYSRYLTTAFSGKTYNLQYSVTPGYHATDLAPTFYNINANLDIFGHQVSFPLIPGFGSFAQAYQSYLTSHARCGGPNKYRKIFNIPPAISWPRPDASGEDMRNVLNAGDWGFSVVTDQQLPKSHCEFWLQWAAAVTNLGGYAAPGTAQTQGLVEVGGNASVNYATG